MCEAANDFIVGFAMDQLPQHVSSTAHGIAPA
jgi:hypothetical protein